MNLKSAFGLLAVLLVPSVAGATTITWDFSGNSSNLVGSPTSGDLGAGSRTYTSSGVSIIASPSAGKHLYGKNSGGDENGLGLAGNSDNEITPTTFVQLDLNNLLSGYNTFQFATNSTTDGEQWKYCFSSVAGSFGTTLCQTGSANTAFNSLGNSLGARYFSLEAFGNVDCHGNCQNGNHGDDEDGTPSNVLLYKFSANSTTSPTVPEPGSLVLLGSGLISAGLRLRKRLS